MSRRAPNGPAGRRSGHLDYGLLPHLIGYHLRRATFRVFTDFGRAAADLRITPGQYGVMTLIGNNPGLSQSALARAVGVERSTMVAVIDGLERRGLLVRHASPVDRRSYALMLTPEGELLRAELDKVVKAHEERVAGHLSKEEKATLVDLLQRLGEPR